MARADNEEDPAKLRCPLCPESGPPTASAVSEHSTRPDDKVPPPVDPKGSTVESQDGPKQLNGGNLESPDLYWIGCSKCKEWYHSVCLLLDADAGKQSVSKEIVAWIEEHDEEDVWSDWTSWVDRWSANSGEKCRSDG